MKGLEAAGKAEIQAGVVEASSQKSGKRQTSNALILKRLDQGPVGKKKKKWDILKSTSENTNLGASVKGAIKQISRGRPKQGLKLIASRYGNRMKDELRRLKKSPALEPSTIEIKRRKGSSKPSKPGFDDGDLMRAIDSKVVL